MNKTIVTHLKDKNDDLIGIRVQTKKDDFNIPVLDVRRSEDTRRKVNVFRKDANAHRGSKFMKTTYSLWGYRYN